MDDLRAAAAEVARRARWVRIETERIGVYAQEIEAALRPPPPDAARPGPEHRPDRESLTARWLILDAINFGSGWFDTLRKRPGLSGSRTIAAALTEHFDAAGPWSAQQLTGLDGPAIAAVLEQPAGHELMGLYAASLRDLGRHILDEHDGTFTHLVDGARSSAVALARRLGTWASFADTSTYGELTLPFLKRAQIAAADLHRAGAAHLHDLPALTMFADNLVPHVLRLDGILRFDPGLVERIERRVELVHGSAEEVEMRAGAVEAVERIVAALRAAPHPDRLCATAAAVDEVLWHRGQGASYKAVPRPRCRTTAY